MIPEPYRSFIDDLRAIYQRSGSQLFCAAEDWDMNKFHPSKSGQIELVLDYGGLNEIRTPIGSHPALGSRTVGDDDLAFDEINKKYGLKEIEPQKPDAQCHYCPSGPVYVITKNVPLTTDN